MKKTIKIELNLNDQVIINVKPEGRKLLDNKPFTSTISKKIDNEGNCQLQLWEVMLHFGSELYMGNMDLPISTNITLLKNKEGESE